VLHTIRAFTGNVEQAGSLPARLTDAVCILSRGQDTWRAAFGSFLLARQAGLDIEYAWGEDTLPESPVYLLPDVQVSTMTSTIYDSDYPIVMYPYAQIIEIEEIEGVEVQELLTTSEAAYEKVGLADGESTQKNDTDRTGSFTVAAYASKVLDEEKTAELVLYTSPLVFTDSTNQYTMNNNLKLFTNAVSAFAGEGESISVPVKSYTEEYLTVSMGTAIVIGAVITLIIPIAMLIFGFMIWYKRRKR